MWNLPAMGPDGKALDIWGHVVLLLGHCWVLMRTVGRTILSLWVLWVPVQDVIARSLKSLSIMRSSPKLT